MTRPDALAHQPKSATSGAAARAASKTSRGARSRVYYDLLANGPSTAEAVSIRLAIPYDSAKPRLHELRERGLALVDPELVERTSTGSSAAVWRAQPNPDAERILATPREAKPGRVAVAVAAIQSALADIAIACGRLDTGHPDDARDRLKSAFGTLGRCLEEVRGES